MNQETSRNDLKDQIKEIRSTNSEIMQKAIIYAAIYAFIYALIKRVTTNNIDNHSCACCSVSPVTSMLMVDILVTDSLH